MRGLLVAGILMIACAQAQVKGSSDSPVPLAWLATGLGDPDAAEIPELISEVRRVGLGFDLGEPELAAILKAAADGKRNSDDVAKLVMVCLNACEKCRARAIAPLTKADLKTLLKWGFSPDAIWDEARIRTVPDMEISKATADELRETGALDDLIARLLPDDKMPTAPPEGEYRTLALRNSETYNANAPKGWLKVTADLPANSQNEFVFKHSALFARAVKGEEATVDLENSAFNRPTPRNTEKVYVELEDQFLDNLDQKSGLRRGAAKVKFSVEYLAADPDGRNAFQIQIMNMDKNPQRCSFSFGWKVRTTPKPPANSAKQQ